MKICITQAVTNNKCKSFPMDGSHINRRIPQPHNHEPLAKPKWTL